jgi:F-type H+-transporting ATPase subunit gamma
MAVGKEIRTKIQSIKNTQKITRAMEMVAASKMRRVQDRMLKAIPYATAIREVMAHVASANPEYKHPFLQRRTVKRAGYILISTDRGLCGGLNTNCLKQLFLELKQNQVNDIASVFCVIGGKGASFIKRYGGEVLGQATHLGDAPTLEQLIGVVRVMLEAYLAGEIDAVYICSNHFVNTMTQKPQIQNLLPVADSELQEKDSRHWDYIYEPDEARVLLDSLLTRYVESQVYRSVIENIACEQAARMVAMKNATENASDIIADLQLVYHKARQSAITQELSEIVAGAAVI